MLETKLFKMKYFKIQKIISSGLSSGTGEELNKY